MGRRHEPGTVYFIKGNKDGHHPQTCLFTGKTN